MNDKLINIDKIISSCNTIEELDRAEEIINKFVKSSFAFYRKNLEINKEGEE